MDQEKIGKFIKQIRKDHHLTQVQLAQKYGVTYQAVSKWENGKNIPDIVLLKQMSKDFQVNIEDILDGQVSSSKKQSKISSSWVIIFLLFVVILLTALLFFKQGSDQNFEFKTLSSSCDQFMITGSIAYNQNRSSIYISDIVYCGEPEPTLYSKIDCGLYEVESNVETMISSCDYKGLELITIDDFLKDITIHAENYERTCKEYSSNSLFLEIGATDIKGKTTTYKIPLQLEGNCHSYQNNS